MERLFLKKIRFWLFLLMQATYCGVSEAATKNVAFILGTGAVTHDRMTMKNIDSLLSSPSEAADYFSSSGNTRRSILINHTISTTSFMTGNNRSFAVAPAIESPPTPIGIHLFQTRTWEFNLTRPGFRSRPHPSQNVSWVVASFGHEYTPVMQRSQRTMWVQAVPFESRAIFTNLSSLDSVLHIGHASIQSCTRGILMKNMIEVIERSQFDVIILDWITNECMMTLFEALKPGTPKVMTNFMGHITVLRYVNIPTVVSYVPHAYSSIILPMTFPDRIVNALDTLVYLFHAQYQDSQLRGEYRKVGDSRISGTEYQQYTSKSFLFMNPVEQFTDMAKPTNIRYKYAGHIIDSPQPLAQIDFKKELGISQVSPDGVILAVFGSLVTADYVPKKLLQGMMNVFSQVNQTVIFSGFKNYENIDSTLRIPSNVYCQYQNTKILFFHGGLHSVLESNFKIPLLTIGLHSDPKYRGARFKELGVSEHFTPFEFTEADMLHKLKSLLNNAQWYKRNLKKLKDRLQSMNKLELSGRQQVNKAGKFPPIVKKEDDPKPLPSYKNIQQFWTQYAIRNAHLFKPTNRFITLQYQPFFSWYCLDLILMFAFISLLTTDLIIS